MTAWNQINPNQLLPSGLSSAASAVSNVIESALSAASAALSLPSFPTLPSLPSTTSIVVNAILDTLESLLKGGKIHTLVVPIAKTVPLAPPPSVPPTLDDLQRALAVSLGPTDTIAAQAYAKLVAQTGGNSGFYNAFATSLMDITDPNRPQYDNGTDAVVMAALLIGAPQFSSIAAGASMIDQLTHPKSGNTASARTVPTPQNLKTRVVGSSVAENVGVRLDWDVPKAAYESIYFPGVSLVVNRYAVIRSTDPKSQGAKSVLDFFPTQALTQGLTSGKAKVVSIGHGLGAAYLDTDKQDPKVPAYYCVAWETVVTEPKGTSTLAFDRVSNVSKLAVAAPQPQQTGNSPDWIATGSAIEAFPPLAQAAQTLIEQTRVLATPSADASGRLGDAMKLAQTSATRLSARAAELLLDVQQLSTALSRPIPSLYVTQMSSATGGNVFLLSELAKRLGDMTDPTRPPFDHGEYVCGVCFVAGAPRLADLAGVIAFFDALFGPANASNPLLGVLAAINTAVTQAETAVFGPDMRPLPAGTSTDPTVAGSIDPTTGQPYPPSTPVIADDGTPVAADDPKNPNAGNTNVTPVSELC